MKTLMKQFLSLGYPIRMGIGTLLTLAIIFGAYSYMIKPVKTKVTAESKKLQSVSQSFDLQKKQLVKLRTVKDNLDPTGSHLQLMTQGGNTISRSDEITEVLNDLRDTVEAVGGRNVDITEDPSEKVLVRLGGNAGNFTLYSLPIELTFQADYNTVSKALYQLRAKRLMLGIPNVEIRANDYTRPGVTAKLKMALMYREEI